ncbi:hypothetical protein [Reichenbachiella sp.]|uniref:hypothetical protein n=1 Tax=Reichenbachiella sp. TaxID=2184521 RepID=UPI00329935CF
MDSLKISKEENQLTTTIETSRPNESTSWYEETWATSLLFPLIIAVIVAKTTNFMSARKSRAELEKVKEETDKLKKSFQPIVFSALHSIQEKTIGQKINGLKELIEVRNKITSYKPIYSEEGEPQYPQGRALHEVLFKEFEYKYCESFSVFHDNFSFLFPDQIMDRNKFILQRLLKLHDDTGMYWDAVDGNPSVTIGYESADYVCKTIDMIEESINDIRKDCHLDSTFIGEFIDNNKILS